MRSIGGRLGWTAASLAAAFAMGACGSRGESTGAQASLDAGLQRDLQLAAAAGVELAGGQNAPRTRFVSAAEGMPAGEGTGTTRADARGTARHRAPTRGVRRVAEVHRAPAAAETPAPTVAVAEAPAATTTNVVDEAPAPGPAATPAPEPERPVPAAGDGDGSARGDGAGTEQGRRRGGWIGVVLRGGGVGDDDHCERDRPGRRGGGMVNRRFPGGGWGGPVAGLPGTIINRTPWPR